MSESDTDTQPQAPNGMPPDYLSGNKTAWQDKAADYIEAKVFYLNIYVAFEMGKIRICVFFVSFETN